jgi:hypothetical protein
MIGTTGKLVRVNYNKSSIIDTYFDMAIPAYINPYTDSNSNGKTDESETVSLNINGTDNNVNYARADSKS